MAIGALGLFKRSPRHFILLALFALPNAVFFMFYQPPDDPRKYFFPYLPCSGPLPGRGGSGGNPAPIPSHRQSPAGNPVGAVGPRSVGQEGVNPESFPGSPDPSRWCSIAPRKGDGLKQQPRWLSSIHHPDPLARICSYRGGLAHDGLIVLPKGARHATRCNRHRRSLPCALGGLRGAFRGSPLFAVTFPDEVQTSAALEPFMTIPGCFTVWQLHRGPPVEKQPPTTFPGGAPQNSVGRQIYFTIGSPQVARGGVVQVAFQWLLDATAGRTIPFSRTSSMEQGSRWCTWTSPWATGPSVPPIGCPPRLIPRNSSWRSLPQSHPAPTR